MTDFKPAKSQPIAGLEIQSEKICANVYARIVHKSSGLVVHKFTSSPIKGIKDLTAQIVENLSDFDWTQSAEDLQIHADKVRNALMNIDAYKNQNNHHC